MKAAIQGSGARLEQYLIIQISESNWFRSFTFLTLTLPFIVYINHFIHYSVNLTKNVSVHSSFYHHSIHLSIHQAALVILFVPEGLAV